MLQMKQVFQSIVFAAIVFSAFPLFNVEAAGICAIARGFELLLFYSNAVFPITLIKKDATRKSGQTNGTFGFVQLLEFFGFDLRYLRFCPCSYVYFVLY